MMNDPLPMTAGDWSWLFQQRPQPDPMPAQDVPMPPVRPASLTPQPAAAPAPRPQAYPAPRVQESPLPAASPTPAPAPSPYGTLQPPKVDGSTEDNLNTRRMIANLVSRGLISPDRLGDVYGVMSAPQ